MILQKIKNSKNIRDGLGFLGTSIASQAINFLLSIFIIRQLGPELRGYYSFLGIVGFFLIPIFSFGFLAGLGYYISSKKYSPGDVTKSVIVIALLRSGIIIFAVLLLKYFNLLGQTGNKISAWYLLPVLFTFPLNMMKESFHRMLLADSQYAKANKLSIVYSIISPVIVFILVVLFKLEFLGVVIAIVASNVLTFIITCTYVNKLYGVFNLRKPFNKLFVKEVFRYGIKGWIGDIAVTTNNRVDQLILSYFLPATSLGIYSICGNIGQMLWILPGSIRQILFNKNAEMEKEEDRKALTARYHAFFMITGVVITVFSILLAKYIVRFLYGNEFLPAVFPLQIYLAGTGIYIGTMILTKYFAGAKQIIFTTYIQLFSAAIGLITAFLLIKDYGIVGAAISSSISYMTSYLLAIYFFKDFKQLANGFVLLFKKGL
ncbi:MAG: oligosaccharide flippase family protein [Ferruginibacter sp.]